MIGGVREESIRFERLPVLDEHLVPELASESPPLTSTSYTDLIDRSTTTIRSLPPALQSHKRQPFRQSLDGSQISSE